MAEMDRLLERVRKAAQAGDRFPEGTSDAEPLLKDLVYAFQDLDRELSRAGSELPRDWDPTVREP